MVLLPVEGECETSSTVKLSQTEVTFLRTIYTLDLRQNLPTCSMTPEKTLCWVGKPAITHVPPDDTRTTNKRQRDGCLEKPAWMREGCALADETTRVTSHLLGF